MAYTALNVDLMYKSEELIGDFYKPIHKVKYWLFTTLDKLRKKLKKIDVNDVRAYSY